MRIGVDVSALRHSRWYGHLLRFVLGGAVTAAAGLVAKAFGPGVGGFMLAFPAILPAALILLQQSQNEQARPPVTGARGRRAAVLAATGAAIGSLGLAAFALIAWKALQRVPSWLALIGATIGWAVIALAAWVGRERLRRRA